MRLLLSIAGFLLIVGASIQNVASVPASIELKPTETKSENPFALCDYYVEDAVAGHAQAKTHCQELGYDGLLTIETEDKLPEIYAFLDAYPPGTTYWIDGYFAGGTQWRWSNGVLLPPNPAMPDWNPWMPGHPVNVGTNNVALLYFNQFNNHWESLPFNQPHKYICELCHPLTEPVPCRETNDLVIVLDSSNSISPDNYVLARDFVAKLALAYEDYSQSRQGLVVFSTDVLTSFELTNTLTRDEMNATIRAAPHMQLNTNTAGGIRVAMDMLTTVQRDFPMNMVILTDGESNEPALTKAAAELALSKGIRMFAVGVNGAVNQELLDIVGGKSDSVFFTQDFDKLVNLLRPISIRVCQED